MDKNLENKETFMVWRDNQSERNENGEHLNHDCMDDCSLSNGDNPVKPLYYYGVYIPSEKDSSSVVGSETLVFTDKHEALVVFKKNKKARFKAFTSEEEASNFSLSGGGDQVFCDNPPVVSGDKSLFKGPKSQDLVKFRKAIEKDDIESVRYLIEENPRYLVGSGDTPTILQEGSRYNALHVAARSNAPAVCKYILNSITDLLLIKRLYGHSNTDHEERRDILLDLFLNMPDKGWNETPLHFASKLGAVDIVRILISYPACDKLRKNKNGQTPAEIVCNRAPQNLMQYKQDILSILNDEYYVPVLRSEDNSLPPAIGEPFTPSQPPALNNEIISKPLEIKAVAGPMSEEEAKTFRKKWKTPPRTGSPLLSTRPELSDPDKGLEKIGRILAQDFHVQWREYWPFLNDFCDIASQQGLDSLENFLKNEFRKSSEGCLRPLFDKDRKVSPSSVDSLARKLETLTLNSSLSDGSETPKGGNNISLLSSGNLSGIASECDFDLSMSKDSPLLYEIDQDAMCESYKGKSFPLDSSTFEKFCQVFASRIGDTLAKGTKNGLSTEIARFQLFLGRCAADERFKDIELQKAHYKLCVLTKEKILEMNGDSERIVRLLSEIISSQHYYDDGYKKISAENIVQATMCVSRSIMTLISQCANIEKSKAERSVDISCVPEACSCILPIPRGIRPRYIPRMLFRSEIESDRCEQTKPSCDESKEESCDTDEEEFHTAPSSPVTETHESSEDLLMLPSETGPSIFLTGTRPTKLDRLVLEALENVHIPLQTYPHIVLWKQACLDYTKETPKDSWATPLIHHRFHKEW